MGFLDNFKSAMAAAKDAANANIERQRAEQQKQQPMARTAAGRPVHARPQSRLPEGVVAVKMNPEEPFDLGTNAQGQNVKVVANGLIHAKPMGMSSLDAEGQKQEIRTIAREVLQREMVPQINSMGDLKFLMLFANRMNQVIVAELNAHGYQAIFKLPLMIRPVQQ